jgi:hypothetical protein
MAMPTGEVGMIDLNDSSPTYETLVSLDEPWGLAIGGDTLYIAQQGPDTISFMDISTLSNPDNAEIKSALIFPNPASDLVWIANRSEAVDYKVSDLSGKVILSNTLQVDDSIDVSSLAKGMYILQVEGYTGSYKIIKE